MTNSSFNGDFGFELAAEHVITCHSACISILKNPIAQFNQIVAFHFHTQDLCTIQTLLKHSPFKLSVELRSTLENVQEKRGMTNCAIDSLDQVHGLRPHCGILLWLLYYR